MLDPIMPVEPCCDQPNGDGPAAQHFGIQDVQQGGSQQNKNAGEHSSTRDFPQQTIDTLNPGSTLHVIITEQMEALTVKVPQLRPNISAQQIQQQILWQIQWQKQHLQWHEKQFHWNQQQREFYEQKYQQDEQQLQWHELQYKWNEQQLQWHEEQIQHSFQWNQQQQWHGSELCWNEHQLEWHDQQCQWSQQLQFDEKQYLWSQQQVEFHEQQYYWNQQQLKLYQGPLAGLIKISQAPTKNINKN